jgi:hypothetical protein
MGSLEPSEGKEGEKEKERERDKWKEREREREKERERGREGKKTLGVLTVIIQRPIVHSPTLERGEFPLKIMQTW